MTSTSIRSRWCVAASCAAIALVGVTPLLSSCGLCSRTSDCPLTQVCSAEGRCVDLVENPDTSCFEDGEATIRVHVTAPDRTTPAGTSTVVIDGDGASAFDTDPSGEFDITLSAGEHTISVSREGFSGQTTFIVCGGRDQDVFVPVKPPPHSIAIVPGAFDSIEDVLSTMGFAAATDYDVLDPTQLASPGALDNYLYTFINCGHSLSLTDPNVQANLTSFVDNGGALYASDLAFDVLETYWPAAATNLGGGNPGLYTGTILDPELEEYLGKNTVELDYNLGGWMVLQSAGEGTRVMVSGTSPEVNGQPLLLQFDSGAGRVTYTTFHNEAQTTFDMDRILAFLVFTL